VSLGKKDIVKNISSKAQISSGVSKVILDKFLDFIASNSFNKLIKISKFGTFYIHETPKRTGRNPLTKKEYVIKKRRKLSFKASNNIRNIIN
tara:strand:- start:50 stop:325 length:276 start_codon:yes stop_codon:yes gene_type:complete